MDPVYTIERYRFNQLGKDLTSVWSQCS